MTFSRIIYPFTPTQRLQEHFRQYLFEYAAFGRERLRWPKDVIGWRICDKYGDEAGYVWLQHGREKIKGERWLMMAVYDEFRRRRFADAALKFVESQLAGLGISTLRGQVNRNKEGAGRVVRAWLLRNGFRVVRPKDDAKFSHLSDEVYAAHWPNVVKFAKTYPAEQSNEQAGAEDSSEAHYPPVVGSKIVDALKRRQMVERMKEQIMARREGGGMAGRRLREQSLTGVPMP